MATMKDEDKTAWRHLGHALEVLALSIRLHYEEQASESMGDPVAWSERQTATPRELAAIVGSAFAAVGDALNDPAVRERCAEVGQALDRAFGETIRALPGTGRQAGDPQPYLGDLDEVARESEGLRRVLFTGRHSRLAVMTLAPGEVISGADQPSDRIILLLEGQGECEADGMTRPFTGRRALCVPAGAPHQVRNTGERTMRIATLYAPPQPLTEPRTQPRTQPVQRAGTGGPKAA